MGYNSNRETTTNQSVFEGVHEEEELRSNYFVPHNLEPGLDDRQLSRLLGLELGTAVTPSIEKTKQKEKKTESKSKYEFKSIS